MERFGCQQITPAADGTNPKAAAYLQEGAVAGASWTDTEKAAPVAGVVVGRILSRAGVEQACKERGLRGAREICCVLEQWFGFVWFFFQIQIHVKITVLRGQTRSLPVLPTAALDL